MSGAKSGGIGLGTFVILAGAPVVLAVAGTAYVAGAAVRAYTDARDRINRARELAMNEQRENVNGLINFWKEKLSTTEQEVSPPKIRSIEESLADMAAAGPMIISSSTTEELKDYIPLQKVESPTPYDDQWRKAEQKRCKDVIDCMEEIVRSMTEPLSDSIVVRLSELYQINDAQELSERALDIRLEINKYVQQIKNKLDQDKAKARQLLDTLPEDCPPDAHSEFQKVADGSSPFTDELQQLYADLKETQQRKELEKKEVDRKNKEIASEVIRETLEKMGYEVGCVRNNLLANGSETYIRNDQWDDGYCVKLNIVEDRILFNAVKDGDSDQAQDASMERAWEGEFKHITDRLNEAKVFIKDIRIISEPGETPTKRKDNIPINTKKKGTSSAAQGTESFQAKMYAERGANQ